MRWMLGVWLAVCASAAEPLDLSGPWKWHEGDDPRYARPDYDDSAWSTRVLPRGATALGHSWYRRRAVAPVEPGEYSLALGPFSHCFSVFVNGVRIGGTDCPPSGDPPFPLAKQYPVPAGLIPPGSPFVVALQAEGRWPSWIVAARLPDRGPYLLGDAATVALRVELTRLQMEKSATPFAWFTGFYLGAALLMLGLWTTNRDRRELLWFGSFELMAGLYWFSLADLVFAGEYAVPAASWFLPAANLLFGCAAYSVLHGRDIGRVVAAAWVAATAASLLLLPRPCFHVVVALPTAWWAVATFRRGPAAHRAFASAVFVYSASNLNSSASQLWQGAWPVPSAFYLGPFLVSVTPLTSGTLILIMLVLLLRRLAGERREQQRLGVELESARTVQRLLLPQAKAQGQYVVEAAFEPAREVGGDFYQIADLPGGGCMVAVGDVSGKGLEAAMVASVAVGAFRSAAAGSPAEVLAIMNRALAGHGRQGFVTCVCVRFDPDGAVVAANAGHPAPYGGGVEMPVDSGLPLGISVDAEYGESRTVFREQVTFVSDGVVEAENPQRELFGFDRTREISTKSAGEIAEAAKAWGQNDDITVVTVRRTS